MANQNNPNVGLGSDPSNLLYQFASSGGGFTQLQRSATDLGGAAGEALATSEILQQATQSIGGAINTGMNIYTDEKARQFKMKMFDTLQSTERSLLGVDDPAKHKEIYQKALDGLNTELSESGIMKKDDLDNFTNIINNQANHYNETNHKLTLQKAGNDSQDIINKINTTIDSVKMNDQNIISLINNSYSETFDTLRQGGWSEEEAKKLATQNMTKTIFYAMNSKTNINFDKTLKDYLSAKENPNDEKSDYVHFKQIQGADRIELSRKRTDISGQNDVNEITLGHAQGKVYGRKYILSRTDIDPIRQARLIEADDRLSEQRKIGISSQWMQDYFNNNKEVWRNTLSEIDNQIRLDSSVDEFAKKTGQDPIFIRQKLIQDALNLRKDYEKDPVGFLQKNPRYVSQPRDVLINIQKQSGIINPSILSNREEQLYTDLYNKVRTPEEKLQVANFTHPESIGLLSSIGIKDTLQQKQFADKYKYNIMLSIGDKQINPKNKVVFEMLARNKGDDPKINNIAQTILSQTDPNNDNKLPQEKDKSDMNAFNQTPLMKKLLSNRDTLEMANVYRDAYKTSGIKKNDFINAINLDVITSGNKDILFEKNILDKKYVNSTLDSFVYDNKSFPEEIQKDEDKLLMIRSHGEWRNDGQDRFKYVYNGNTYLHVNVDKNNNTLQRKNIFEDKTPKQSFIQTMDSLQSND